MKILILVTLVFSQVIMANDCNYTLNTKDLKLTWTAYKTPLKAGVNGSFDELGVNKNITAKKREALISNISFKIDTKTVNTGNPERDQKIAKFFFEPMGSSITGKTLNYSKKILKVQITMNGITQTIPLKVSLEPESFKAEGVMDILDFNGAMALTGINTACKELHEGKTWSDVALSLSGSFSKTCK